VIDYEYMDPVLSITTGVTAWVLVGPLQDLNVFNSVELDTTFGTLQWPNGADFDPETLHDWPKYHDELVAMARRWATALTTR
jgi:hypothetical protein